MLPREHSDVDNFLLISHKTMHSSVTSFVTTALHLSQYHTAVAFSSGTTQIERIVNGLDLVCENKISQPPWEQSIESIKRQNLLKLLICTFYLPTSQAKNSVLSSFSFKRRKFSFSFCRKISLPNFLGNFQLQLRA